MFQNLKGNKVYTKYKTKQLLQMDNTLIITTGKKLCTNISFKPTNLQVSEQEILIALKEIFIINIEIPVLF